MLSVTVRSDLAPMMCRFLKTDYEWNWRFRQNFCEQLAESLHLFTPLDMYHHIHEVCLSLLMDRISSVRQSALSLVITFILNSEDRINCVCVTRFLNYWWYLIKILV